MPSVPPPRPARLEHICSSFRSHLSPLCPHRLSCRKGTKTCNCYSASGIFPAPANRRACMWASTLQAPPACGNRSCSLVDGKMNMLTCASAFGAQFSVHVLLLCPYCSPASTLAARAANLQLAWAVVALPVPRPAGRPGAGFLSAQMHCFFNVPLTPTCQHLCMTTTVPVGIGVLEGAAINLMCKHENLAQDESSMAGNKQNC